MLSFAIPMYLQTCGNFYGHLEQQHHFFWQIAQIWLQNPAPKVSLDHFSWKKFCIHTFHICRIESQTLFGGNVARVKHPMQF